MAATRFPLLTLGLVLVCAAIQSNSELTRWIEFDLRASLRGELWRLFTGHLCHYNQSHFVGDVAAFLVWASAVELLSRRMLIAALASTPLVLAAWLFSTGTQPLVYRGLSAIDCALATQLWTVAFLSSVAQRRVALRVVLVGVLVIMLLKSGYEFATGHAILAPELGANVRLLPAAHVFGVLVGIGTAFWHNARARWARTPRPSLLSSARSIFGERDDENRCSSHAPAA